MNADHARLMFDLKDEARLAKLDTGHVYTDMHGVPIEKDQMVMLNTGAGTLIGRVTKIAKGIVTVDTDPHDRDAWFRADASNLEVLA